MTKGSKYTPRHDRSTRLADARRAYINRRVEQQLSEITLLTETKTQDISTMANNTNTITHIDTSSDITHVTVEKFDGVNGLKVGDFIRNVEANGVSKGLTGEALDKYCVSLARNRIDLTKSPRLQDVTRLIDVQPEKAKNWAFVKEVLSASFGIDNEKPEYKFGTFLKATPQDTTTAGLATFLCNLRARFQEWTETKTPPEMTLTVNDDCETIHRISKFLAVSFLSTLVPEEKRANAVDILRETTWDNLANKTSEMISTTAGAYAVRNETVKQSTEPTFQPVPAQTTRDYQDRRVQRPTRGRGQPRGGRSRGQHYGAYTPRQNSTATAATYWPTRNQCQRCARHGHWARTCTNQPFCTFHETEGHAITECLQFKASFPSFFVQGGDPHSTDQQIYGEYVAQL